LNIKHVKLALAAVALIVIAASVGFVGFHPSPVEKDLSGQGSILSPTGTSYTQPTVPAAVFASTVTNTPATVDGSAPTTLATPLATVGSKNAATPENVCRHWDYCLPMTMGLNPPDQQ
jgi:hypothetical protein